MSDDIAEWKRRAETAERERDEARAELERRGDIREVSFVRGGESGWVRIGLYDSVRRRSSWVRLVGEDDMGNVQAIELCSGREGDDAYVKLTSQDPQWDDLCDVLLRVEGDCGLHVRGRQG